MNNHKPIFHITGEKGWINDPNGVVKFHNQYHIFYQHHPYSNVWGPMHWGHVVSDDLIHFKYLPIALTPGDEFDKDGCFSGTSLVKDDTLYVVYTGFIHHDDPDKVRQIQCLATSKDGIRFVKHGAIITGKDLPKKYKSCDFRDPKLTYKDGYYYLFAVAKKVDGSGGSIVLFKSKDLYHWEFLSDVLTHNSEGEMLECVDYHEDLGLMLYSEQNFPSDNDHCLNIHSCEYEIGKLNSEYKFISSGKHLIDYGFDFYAAQIMNDDHYLIGWLDMWGRNNPSDKYGFAGMLTIPRKVYIEDGLMLQTPVIYGKLDKTINIKDTYEGHLSIGSIILEIDNLESLSISLRMGKDEETKFYLKDNEFYFDRSKSGELLYGDEKDELSLKGIRKMPYRRKDKDIIYIIMDKYSIEIFVNGISMSNIVYPKDDSDIFKIDAVAKNTTLNVYK